MKKFMTILLPLAAAAATVAAQGLGGFKNQLAAPDGSYGSRIQITEHGTAASAVSSMQTNQSGVKIRGYRVRIFSDNSQNARSAGQNALSRFRELYPGIPADMTYDTPYFKVTVGNCLTAEEATILWGRSKTLSTAHSSPAKRFRCRLSRRASRFSPTVPPGMPPQKSNIRGFRSRRRFGYTKNIRQNQIFYRENSFFGKNFTG